MDNADTYLKANFDIENIFDVIAFRHDYPEQYLKKLWSVALWFSQGFYNKYDNDDIYCDLYNSENKKYYEINLVKETHTKLELWVKNVNIIKRVSNLIPDDLCFYVIKQQFESKLLETLRQVNNKKRGITNIIVPVKESTEKVTKIETPKRDVYQYVGFYHGVATNNKYACVGFFLNRFSFIKVLFRWEFGRVILKSVAIPWYNSNGENFTECKRKYTFRVTNLKASGYGLKLKKRNPYIQTMRPTKLEKQTIKYPCVVSEKIDGVRCQLVYENGVWVPYSRRGLCLHNVDSIANFINKLPITLRKCVLNIEIVYRNGTLSQISGALNSDFPKQNHYKEVRYYLFDVTPCMKNKYPVFDEKLNIKTYVEADTVHIRLLNVLYINKYCIEHKYNLLRSTQFKVIDNQKQFDDFYNRVDGKGGEGIVIHNDLNDIYSPGRNKNILKKKRFMDIEVVLNNIISGTGSHSKRAIAQFIYKGKRYNSSINGEQREHDEYLANKKKYIGKIMTIRVVASDSIHEIRHPTVVSINSGK